MLSHFSCVQLFAPLWTVAHQAPLSMGFSRQEYCHALLQGIFPIQGSTCISYVSCIGRFFTTSATRGSLLSILYEANFIYLFIHLFVLWPWWVFIAAHGLSLAAVSGGYSSWWCVGFSLGWLLLWSTGSKCTGLRSCSTWAR